MDATGRILMANEAAHRLLGFEPENLPGWSIKSFVPSLANVPHGDRSAPSFRTAMRCYGRRRDGEAFLADVWFSSYQTRPGPRLAAMLVDVSEDLRDREEFSLHQLMAGSRLVVSAVSHEIRNLCSAISVVHANLARDPELGQKEDFQALSSLVEGLEKVATLELRQRAGSQEITSVDLYSVLDELRIVTEAPLRDSDILIHWELPEGLPRVWADRHNLLQILLNLVKNSQRAVEDEARKEIAISAADEGKWVALRVRDTGPGVASPERLFQPFQPGAESSGLGLYISRAFAHAFEGDLRYESEPGGCWCFALYLTPRTQQERDETTKTNEKDQDSARRRSHAVSRSAEPLARE
jgi:two-component system, LuxR family, sensor kinase FixL